MSLIDDESLWTLPDWVQPGAVFKRNFGDKNPNTAVYHVLAIVDDDMMVLKHWGKRANRWLYCVESPLFITFRRDDIIEVKKRVKSNDNQSNV